MSNMLEQAIIDADALKEAALKNAETLVLEKYSNQIKNNDFINIKFYDKTIGVNIKKVN